MLSWDGRGFWTRSFSIYTFDKPYTPKCENTLVDSYKITGGITIEARVTPQPALCQTNRQLRVETLPLFYDCAILSTGSKAQGWTRHVGKHCLDHLEYLELRGWVHGEPREIAGKWCREEYLARARFQPLKASIGMWVWPMSDGKLDLDHDEHETTKGREALGIDHEETSMVPLDSCWLSGNMERFEKYYGSVERSFAKEDVQQGCK